MGISDLLKPNVGKLRKKKDINGLIKSLYYKRDYHVRMHAAEALGEIGDKRSVDPLIHALENEDGLVRKYVAEALGKIGDERAVDPLIHTLVHALENADGFVQKHVGEVVMKIGQPAVEPLILALEHKDKNVRSYVAWALGRIGDKRAVGPLIHALENEDGLARSRVIEALGKIGDERAVDPLIHALENEDEVAPMDAAEALGKIGDERAVDSLIHALENGDKLVQRHAAGALFAVFGNAVLGKMKQPVVEPLILALKHKDKYVREKAAEILTYIAWKPKKEAEKTFYLIAKGEWDELGQLTEPAVDSLIRALEYEDKNIRMHVAETLGKIGDERAVDPLIHALEDEDEDVRKNVAVALGRIGDPRAAACVINYLFSSSPPIDITESMENLLGDYTTLIVKAAYVEVLSSYTNYGSATEIDDVTSFSYELGLSATKELCRIPTQIASNILWVISSIKDRNVPSARIGGWAADWDECKLLSFESQREIARKELSQRKNPPYDPSAYLDRRAWRL